MADQAQLIAQIRFALEQLSERNAQHEWEHLSRHLARERICANILPATGPVQAGGDRDPSVPALPQPQRHQARAQPAQRPALPLPRLRAHLPETRGGP